jgi:hypothetical protein
MSSEIHGGPSSGNKEAPTSGGNVLAGTPSKVAMQMQKMKEANTKYKNLLKMAKERIEQQEQELKRLRGESLVLCLAKVCTPFLQWVLFLSYSFHDTFSI